jgi:hypothetical protein
VIIFVYNRITTNELLCHEDTWRSRAIVPPFFTSALDRAEWLASYPGCFLCVEYIICRMPVISIRRGYCFACHSCLIDPVLNYTGVNDFFIIVIIAFTNPCLADAARIVC